MNNSILIVFSPYTITIAILTPLSEISVVNIVFVVLGNGVYCDNNTAQYYMYFILSDKQPRKWSVRYASLRSLFVRVIDHRYSIQL